MNYFKKYHENHIKIYNMCSEDFAETNELHMEDG